MMVHPSSIVPGPRLLSQLLGCRGGGHRHRHYLHRSSIPGIGIGCHRNYSSVPLPSASATAFQYPPRRQTTNRHNTHHPWNHGQKRSYQISPAEKNSNNDGDDGTGNSNPTNNASPHCDIDEATMEKHNKLSRRLYRTLLRSCREGVMSANEGSSIDNIHNDVNDDTSKSWILLQPPMDQRKYGFAKIVFARRGQLSSSSSSSSSTTVSSDSNSNNTKTNPIRNAAALKMTAEEIGMAMEVLRFVHVSLGGNADDDLEGYYLGMNDDDDGNEEHENNETTDSTEEETEDSVDSNGAFTAAAGRHSEGHYTQFLDEDEERGEGSEDDDELPEVTVEEWGEDDNDDDETLELDPSVLVTSNDLQNAIRIAFRASPLPSSSSSSQSDNNDNDDDSEEEEMQPLSTIIARRHSDAIQACSQLSEQFHRWGSKSSVAVDVERGVRVVATSALMMRPNSSSSGEMRRYRFCYRIRVENIMDILDNNNKRNTKEEEEEPKKMEDGSSGQSDSASTPSVEHRAVQLLGRTWNIYEHGPWHKTSVSMLQRLLQEGGIPNMENADDGIEKEDENEMRVVQTVDEPRTGAVGHLPVLGPGEVFEYMSGADIATPTGAMEGVFHMASVDMQTTDSAHVGDMVEAMHWKSNDERKFEMPIGRFGLVAEEEEDE